MFPVLSANTPAPTSYNLTRSLRFRASAGGFLNRTFPSAGNRKTWTWSAWVKRGALGSNQILFDTGVLTTSDSTFTTIGFSSSDTLLVSGYSVQWKNTTQVFRDPSAWYHIVITWDTTQATASNRVRVYVNGSQVTTFGTTFDPSLNFDGAINQAAAHYFCYPAYSYGYFDGYLAETNFIDGQALTPTSFGSFSTTTGVWQPKKYSGSYGTNGFYLPFTDNSALTTSSNVGLGKDFSGNGNFWTTNNISITSGTTYDSMTDVPTLTSATVCNYPVLNPNELTSAGTLFDGNLRIANYGAWTASKSTMAMPSGKWYAEVTVNAVNYCEIGIFQTNQAMPAAGGFGYPGYSPYGWCLLSFASGAQIDNNNGQTNYGSGISVGDILMMAYDAVNGKCYFGKNGTWYGGSNPATQTNPPIVVPSAATQYSWVVANNGSNNGVSANFGQRPFTYTPPTGFVALNAYNLPTSTIVKGNTVMDATLYTGILAPQNIINAAGFKPDLVWTKSRNFTYSHHLYDSVRGVNKRLLVDLTNAEATVANTLTAFLPNGFTLGASDASNDTDSSSVGWQWQAGQGVTSTNTAGSVTSTVSVNAPAGFSVVTYTGATGGTVGHGLGVAPSFIIVKRRDAASDWVTYHSSLANAKDVLMLLNSNAAAASSGSYWGTGGVTSTVFGTSPNAGYVNNTGSLVAYCWAEIPGFSKFGIYTGNGSYSGPFVYTGLRAKFLLIKSTATDYWIILDTVRNTYNTVDLALFPNTPDPEYPYSYLNILSNGFSISNVGSGINSAGQTYIYMAFAENPFKNALAR